ncbi:hypothetical protein [Mycolicibacterium fallax]|uniref:hypothetical protein n=1 Tax=Mycolicibacterium fallax TaxID=1793 RepID=UPI0010547409|nr:hypothetical protein [Mycolicibacterium fallax]
MIVFQPEAYREAASSFDTLAAGLDANPLEQASVLQAVTARLGVLARDRSSSTLRAIGDLADRLAAGGEISAEKVVEIAATLRKVADGEEQTVMRTQALFR